MRERERRALGRRGNSFKTNPLHRQVGNLKHKSESKSNLFSLLEYDLDFINFGLKSTTRPTPDGKHVRTYVRIKIYISWVPASSRWGKHTKTLLSPLSAPKKNKSATNLLLFFFSSPILEASVHQAMKPDLRAPRALHYDQARDSCA